VAGRHQAAAGGRDASLPRASPGTLARRARIIVSLVWSASPVSTALLCTLALTGGVTPTATAWLQRTVLDGLVPHGPAHRAGTEHIIVLAIMLGVAGMVAAVTQYGRTYVQGQIRRGLGLLTQDRMFRAINSFPGMRRFESPEFADKIQMVQQISNNTASRLISSGLQSATSLITTVGLFGTLVVISPLMAAIVGSTAVPAIAAQFSNGRQRAGLLWKKSPALRRQIFYSQLLSDPRAAKEVRLFGLADFLRGRMLDETRSVNEGQQQLDRRIFLIEGSLSLLDATITAAGTVWVVHQAIAGRLSVGDVSLFAMAVIGVQGALAGVISALSDVYQSLLLFGHYVDLVTAGPDLPLTERPRPVPALRHGIEVRDVWFRYDRQHPWVLRGVSMFIPAGQSAALIGLNGTGKSTLVKLICRLYDPVRGAIFWDGVDIRDVAPEDLRARIGTVFQDYMAYDLTAAENIGLGDVARIGDTERIHAAAGQAGVDGEIAKLPRGYETLLSRIFFDSKDRNSTETGVFLSGGLWQRLAVARGLMRADRDLLILDEPSSGMDAEAEHALSQRLFRTRKDRTSLLISHRLGSVRDAATIYVLSGGRIAERGTHATLMAAGGEYRRLFTLQASGYAHDEGQNAAASGTGRGPRLTAM
jgi:ATP-binding cassette, subfamily B, bacterial